MTLEAADRDALQAAAEILESPSLAIQITNLVGKPIEYGISKLPAAVSRRIVDATSSALQSSLRVAVSTLNSERGNSERGNSERGNSERGRRPSNAMHKVLTTLSGAVGGAFGLPALAIELPVSTTLMFRSMADIARGEGEDIHAIETQLACLEVFALGSSAEADDSAETGYYAARAALARSVSEAAKYLVEKGLVEESAPAIVRLIAKVAARFSVPVSEKFAAQSVPAIGAAGGAAINLIFINHFQEMARGHFTIRRLERKYGAELIEKEFLRLRRRHVG